MQSLPFSSHSSSNNVPHLNLDINGGHQFHFENSNNSNFGLNHIINEGRGFLSSSQPLTAAGTNNSNNQTSTNNTGRGHVGLGLGVLGVSQRQSVMMNTSDHQVRRAANLVALAPQSQTHERVRVHTVIDYFPPAVLQNRSSLLGPNHEVTFTEIVRTQLLTATSTRERILQVSNNNINGTSDVSAVAWNHNIIHEGQGCNNNNNNNNLDLNHSYTESAPQGGLHNNPVGVSYESSSQYQNNLVREHGYNFHHNIFSHNNQFPNPPVPPRSRATLRLIENDDHENYDTAESRSNIGVISRDVKAKRSPCGSSSNVPVPVDHHHHHQIQHTSDDIDSSSDDGDEQMQMMEVGDGRTHSLPCKKYGPYTCPRCMGVFNTSQLFAAHMGSHYKYETASERKRRKEAKYGKKSLRLFHSRDGLTLLPATHDEPSHSSNNNNNINGRRRRRRKAAKRSVLLLPSVKAEPEDHHNELPAPPPPPPTNFDFEGLVEVKVKEEPLDLVFNLGIH